MLVVPVRRSSRCVTVRAPLPACRVTWKVPSRAPSGAKAAELVPTRSRTLPTKARARVGGGRATVKPAARTATWPSGVGTGTSPGPRAAVAPMARATESWVEETTVVDSTVTSAPKAALAPGWKFVPDTVTVRAAPWTPELGATLPIVGTSGRSAVAEAEVPSAKLAATVKLAPLVNGVGLTSEANTTKAAPSATAKLTVPLEAFRSALSRETAAPRAQ